MSEYFCLMFDMFVLFLFISWNYYHIVFGYCGLSGVILEMSAVSHRDIKGQFFPIKNFSLLLSLKKTKTVKYRWQQLLKYLPTSHNLHYHLNPIFDWVEQCGEEKQYNQVIFLKSWKKHICFLSINQQLLNQQNFNWLCDVFNLVSRYILTLNPKGGDDSIKHNKFTILILKLIKCMGWP